MSSDVKHDYHLVDPSSWPIVGSVGAVCLPDRRKADRAAGAKSGADVRDDDADRARRKRNIALGLALGALAVLFYLMSIVQWHEHSGH